MISNIGWENTQWKWKVSNKISKSIHYYKFYNDGILFNAHHKTSSKVICLSLTKIFGHLGLDSNQVFMKQKDNLKVNIHLSKERNDRTKSTSS